MKALPVDTGIKSSSCIPNNFFIELFGGELNLKKDQGQRKKAGCNCMISKDIGSYNLHPCFNNCLFCYANPKNMENTNDKFGYH